MLPQVAKDFWATTTLHADDDVVIESVKRVER